MVDVPEAQDCNQNKAYNLEQNWKLNATVAIDRIDYGFMVHTAI